MTKTIIYTCFCFMFINIVNAQKFKTGKATPSSYHTKIEYEKVRGKIIIPVIINNEHYRFLFDTGAPNLISSSISNKLNQKAGKPISVSDANRNKQKMELTSIPFITIGNVTFKNTSALVFDDSNNLIFDCFDVDGIIGSNLLRKSIVQILPKKQIIILTNQNKNIDFGNNDGIELVLRDNQSSPYIVIKLKGEQKANELLLIDTGASGFYDMSVNNYNIIKKYNIVNILGIDNGTSSLGMFGSSGANTQYRLYIPTLEINNHNFKNVTTITSSDNNSRIGSDILEYGNISIDFRKKKFYFEPFDYESNLEESLWGFTPTIENNKLIVGLVWDESLKTKMSHGDEILSINDVDYTNRDICTMITTVSPFKNVDTLNISFKNKENNIISIGLKKQLIQKQ